MKKKSRAKTEIIYFKFLLTNRRDIMRMIEKFGRLVQNTPARQELIYVAARVVRSKNRLKLRFSCHYLVYPAFFALYNRISGEY
ncbi:hypothetical protein KKHLCK_15205 [Candidatus Electrothrix laxa]